MELSAAGSVVRFRKAVDKRRHERFDGDVGLLGRNVELLRQIIERFPILGVLQDLIKIDHWRTS